VPGQLRPAVLVVQAQERQAEQYVQIVGLGRATADLGTERQELSQEQVRVRTRGGTQSSPNPIAIGSANGLIRAPAVGGNGPLVKPVDHVAKQKSVVGQAHWRREVGVPLAPLGDGGPRDVGEPGHPRLRNRSRKITHEDEVKCPPRRRRPCTPLCSGIC